jgi:hypothetical protein
MELVKQAVDDAGVEAIKIIKAKGVARGDDIRKQIAEKKELLLKEQSAIEKAEGYDLISESKKPGFSKSKAIKIKAELEISIALADDLRGQRDDLHEALSKEDKETNRQIELLQACVKGCQGVRLWLIGGHFNGGLNLQIERIQRGVGRFENLRRVVTRMTDDAELADKCVEQVSVISCPTDALELANSYIQKLPTNLRKEA